MRRWNRLTLCALVMGFIPSFGMSAPWHPAFTASSPCAVLGLDKQEKPVAFCHLNYLDSKLICFDKAGKGFEIGTIYGSRGNFNFHPKKTKSRFVLNLLSQIQNFAYGSSEESMVNMQTHDGFDIPDKEHQLSVKGLVIVKKNGRYEIWELDEESNAHLTTFLGTVPEAILKKMYVATTEDQNYFTAQGAKFVAETQPGYNDPNRNHAGGFYRMGTIYSGTGGQVGQIGSDGTIYSGTGGQIGQIGSDGTIYSGTGGQIGQIGSDGTIYSGTGGQIGRIGSDGTIYSGTGGQIGRIGSDGTVYSGTGGQIGKVAPGDKGAVAYSIIAKAQGMQAPFPGL